MTVSKVICDCCHDTIDGSAYHVPSTNTIYPGLQISFDLCATCMQAYKKRRKAIDEEFFADAVRRMGAYGK